MALGTMMLAFSIYSAKWATEPEPSTTNMVDSCPTMTYNGMDGAIICEVCEYLFGRVLVRIHDLDDGNDRDEREDMECANSPSASGRCFANVNNRYEHRRRHSDQRCLPVLGDVVRVIHNDGSLDDAA